MIKNLNEFKEMIDIYEVISCYVSLKKSGQNHIGCCPFHDEKTPSFNVSPTKGIYHCFGCGVGGDAIDFVQKFEKLEFEEAVIKIAGIMNFSLEFGGYDKNASRQDFSLLQKASDFFVTTLQNSPDAKDYFLKRGLSEESIKKWDLGFCPISFEFLKTLSDEQKPFLLSCGVLNKATDGRIYTPFSLRLIFPIHSSKGKVMGFGGRILDKNTPNQNAKYINSKESKLYKKRQILYGLHLARESIIKKKEVIITEGYMDVIMMHQAGFMNAVGSCGTALSAEQIASVFKLGAKIILCFDSDNAGKNAATKAIHTLIACGVYESEVMLLTGGKDPCELLANNQKDAIENASKIPIVEFMIQNILSEYCPIGVKNPIEAKNIAIIEVKKFLQTIGNEFIREGYIKRAAAILNCDERFLQIQSVKKIQKIRAYDFLEASVIKAMALSSYTLDFVIEWLGAEDFFTLKESFSNLLSNQTDEKIREILLNEEILPPSDIKEAIALLFKKSTQNQILAIRKSTLPIEQKVTQINALNQKLKHYNIRGYAS